MKLDKDARYQETHEWARREDGVILVGITDYAQDSLSDVVYVELPEVGDTKTKGEVFGVVESVKAASDLYMPVSGEIVKVNQDLEDTPELVNDDPYGGGWFIEIKPSDSTEWDDLLTIDAYKQTLG